MKLLSAIIAPLMVNRAFAGKAEIVEGLKQLSAISNNVTAEQYEADKSVAGDRELDTLIMSLIAPVDGYGCWCNFNADYQQSKGPVQDYIDSLCKTLILGYHCGIIDGVTDGEPCDTPTVVYDPYNFFIGGDVFDVCQTKNVDECTVGECNTCAHRACVIEGSFVFNYFTYALDPNSGFAPAPEITHVDQGGLFEPETDCAYQTPGGGRSEKACCGAYPDRFPFKTFEGARACCGQVTYASAALQCCTDPNDNTIKTTLDINDTCPT
jgi:hypothetical protein